jgi:hypothetical protein
MAICTSTNPEKTHKLEENLANLMDLIEDEIDADFEAHGFPPGWEA